MSEKTSLYHFHLDGRKYAVQSVVPMTTEEAEQYGGELETAIRWICRKQTGDGAEREECKMTDLVAQAKARREMEALKYIQTVGRVVRVERSLYHFHLDGRKYAVESVVPMTEAEAEQFANELSKATGKPVTWGAQ